MKRIPPILLLVILVALVVFGMSFSERMKSAQAAPTPPVAVVSRVFPERAKPNHDILKIRLRRARHQRIADLEAYVKMQDFPHNHDFKGERVPYLVDRHGRLCAVAYLFATTRMERFNYSNFMMYNNPANPRGLNSPVDYYSMDSKADPEAIARAGGCVEARKLLYLGVAKEIRTLAAADNQVRVMDLKEGPLWDWILTSGLTIEECALIQPTYSYLCCNDCLPGSEEKGSHGVTFGKPTFDATATAVEDRIRIRKHLRAVLQKLDEDTEASLDRAVLRLP